MNRVAVTGLGILSPVGNNVRDFWNAVEKGDCGIGPIESFDASELNVPIAAEVKNFVPEDHFDRVTLRMLDRFAQLGAVAAREAVAHCGLDFHGEAGRCAAAIVGTAVGGEISLEEGYRRLFIQRLQSVNPFTVPKLMVNAAVGQITIENGIRGPAYAVASACASATHAIGTAFDMVRRGVVEVALTGGAEACISLGTLRGWEGLRVMARDTCRPFSRGRTGMVLGEGAGVIILENLEHARARGANVLCEVIGFGMSADAVSLVQSSVDGAARAIQAAIADSGVPLEAFTYVNAHGTATSANDVVETRALRQVFGAHADRLAVSSTKSMLGHSLGAAGALEFIATVCGMERGMLPPTVNYLGVDPECDLNYVPNRAQFREVEYALSNSFAFGGLNAVLALRHIAA
jgi:nodulation protein E